MSLFGGRHISWRQAVTAAASDAPRQEQATPNAPRMGRWTGRSITTNRLVISVTPARISSALQSADEGYPQDLFELLQEVTDRSPQMNACLGQRKRGVAQVEWCLLPGGPRARDRRVAEQVEGWVRQIAGLTESLVHLLSGIEHGVSFAEIDWQIKGDLALPARLKYAPAAWFKPSPGDPDVWYLLDRQNLIDGVPLIADRWIAHTHQAKPGFPVQAGLGRVLLWYWLFGHYGTKDWVAYSELFGAPLRVGHAPPGAGDEQLDDLADALDKLGVDAYAVLPPDAKVDFVGDNNGKSGPDVYERLIEYTERCIAKRILGQVLTTEASGSNGAGSYALGGVHNAVRMDILRADASQLADTLTRDLIEPIVRFNLGADVAIPRWYFKVEPPRDALRDAQTQTARAEVFKRAVDLGMPVSRAQVAEELDLQLPAGQGDELFPAELPDSAPDDAAEAADKKRLTSLSQSRYARPRYARVLRIKQDYPELWKKGGSTGSTWSGDRAFRTWTAIRARKGKLTPTQIEWINTREAWAARHLGEEGTRQLAGAIAVVKWAVDEARSWAVIDAAIKKIDERRKKEGQ